MGGGYLTRPLQVQNAWPCKDRPVDDRIETPDYWRVSHNNPEDCALLGTGTLLRIHLNDERANSRGSVWPEFKGVEGVPRTKLSYRYGLLLLGFSDGNPARMRP